MDWRWLRFAMFGFEARMIVAGTRLIGVQRFGFRTAMKCFLPGHPTLKAILSESHWQIEAP
jgi:hypothetical protein